MSFDSEIGARFWSRGLAWPRYVDSKTDRLFYTPDAVYMLPGAGHEWLDVPFARALTTQTIDYVQQHGREVPQC